MRSAATCLPVVFAALLAGCETVPLATNAAAAAAPPAVAKTRCDKREVTGSRVARCNDGPSAVGVISGEEIRAAGMPSSGPGRGAEGR